MSSVGSPKKLLNGREIPTRKIVVNDLSQLPFDYSTTPGGTWFSTTPGGTRIVYDRSYLMHLRNSPMARSPPKNLPSIPGVTSPATTKDNNRRAPGVRGFSPTSTTPLETCVEEKSMVSKATTGVSRTGASDEPQFDMDM
ncbi:eukaryotic translation initiation factor 4E-binding protein 2-like [Oppia nitens]|uniref:eukaryotic translation initiation factor 4E-binding protein 2-like n=1 Tax=Oppia nitens TaxID=1686743 RepID=UPI0023DBD137|nr:eukaryotic translation initiation factor 4E-binding protein 2-like [Oppia nitens]